MRASAALYRLLAGRVPHRTGDSTSSLYTKLLRITHEACPSIAARCPELSPALAAVVDRMVARDPAQRFATADEAVTALAPFAETSNLPALLARVPLPRQSSRRKTSRFAIALISMASLAVVSTLVFLIANKGSPPQESGSSGTAPSLIGVVKRPLDFPRGHGRHRLQRTSTFARTVAMNATLNSSLLAAKAIHCHAPAQTN